MEKNDDYTEFAIALSRGDLIKFKRLVAAGKVPPKGCLSRAIGSGCIKLINELINSSYITQGDRNQSLQKSIESKNWILVERLLESGADPNHRFGLTQIPIISLSVLSQNNDLLRRLLAKGASPNAHDVPWAASLLGTPIGKTVLMIAAETGRHEMVRTLLEAGADPWMIGENGKTALELIAKRKDRKAVAAVLSEWMDKHPATATSPSTSKTLDLGTPFASWEDALARLAKITGAKETPHPQAKTIIRFPLTLELATSMARQDSAMKSRLHALETYREALRAVQRLSVKLDAVWFVQFEPVLGALLCGLAKADKWKVLGVVKTACVNFGVTHAALLKFLKSLDAKQPFELIECDSTSLGGLFIGKVKNPEQIANLLFDFCPFVAEDDGGNVKRFAKTLGRTGHFKIWWD